MNTQKNYYQEKVLKQDLRIALKNPQSYFENNFKTAGDSQNWRLFFDSIEEMVIEAVEK